MRVNAAGQGDFFQVHIDTRQENTEKVKDFLRRAFYRLFDLRPQQEFVEPHQPFRVSYEQLCFSVRLSHGISGDCVFK